MKRMKSIQLLIRSCMVQVLVVVGVLRSFIMLFTKVHGRVNMTKAVMMEAEEEVATVAEEEVILETTLCKEAW